MPSITATASRERKIIGLVISGMGVATFLLAREVAGIWVALGSCAVLVVSGLLVKRSCYLFNLRRGTITAFWYVTYLAMIFFPAFVVYSEQGGPYRARFLFAVESVLITVPLGWLLASAWSRFRREEIDFFFEMPVENGADDKLLLRRFWLFLAVCLGLTVAYVVEVQTIPLFYLLSNPGEVFQAAVAREESLKLLDSPLTYFYYVARGLLYPILILIALGTYLRRRQTKWLLMLAVALCGGLFFASLSLAKAPVATIFLVVGIFFYLYNHGTLSKKAVIITLAFLLLFPLFVTLYEYSDESVGPLVAIGAVGYRLFFIPAEVVYYYFEFFPHQVNYLHGRSIDKFARLMGEQPFDTPNAVGNYAAYEGIESVSANGAFICDMNADFGMWGVVLGGILAGVVMQATQILLLRRKKTVASLACFAFLTVAFWFLNSTSLPVVLASDGVILSLLIMWYLDTSGHGARVVAEA